MTALQPLLSYNLSETDLHALFEDFFNDQYDYIPEFVITLDNNFYLPIHISFENPSTRAFDVFWLGLLTDVYRISSYEYEEEENALGDKVFQLILGKPISDYHWDSTYDNCYALVDAASSLEFAHEETTKNKFKLLNYNLEKFIFQPKTFQNFNTDTLTYTMHSSSKYNGFAAFFFEYKNDTSIQYTLSNVSNEKNEVITEFRCNAYYYEEQMLNEIQTLTKKMLEFVTSHFEINKSDILFKETLVATPIPIILHEDLSFKENGIANLATCNFSYQEIMNVLPIDTRGIDNCIQRIRRKSGETHVDYFAILKQNN